MTPAEALAALQSLLSPEVETPEPGFLTMRQWADAWGKSDTRTNALILKGIAAGAVEKRDYRVGPNKRKVPHYRVKA